MVLVDSVRVSFAGLVQLMCRLCVLMSCGLLCACMSALWLPKSYAGCNTRTQYIHAYTHNAVTPPPSRHCWCLCVCTCTVCLHAAAASAVLRVHMVVLHTHTVRLHVHMLVPCCSSQHTCCKQLAMHTGTPPEPCSLLPTNMLVPGTHAHHAADELCTGPDVSCCCSRHQRATAACNASLFPCLIIFLFGGPWSVEVLRCAQQQPRQLPACGRALTLPAPRHFWCSTTHASFSHNACAYPQ